MSGFVVRVYCIGGPCQGLNYLDADTGRVLFNDTSGGQCIYRISEHELHDTYPVAYFDRISEHTD